MKLTKFGSIFASLICLFTVCANVQAAPGDPDATFGTNGITMTDFGFGNFARATAIQPDGKIVVAGYSGADNTSNPALDVLLARYNTNGSPDAGFGTNGSTIVAEPKDQFPVSVLIQADGKMLVIGYERQSIGATNYAMTIHRFDSNGILDATFGTSGKVVHWLQNKCEARDAVLQPDGKIIIAGSISSKFTVFRLNADGSLDQSFNSTGYNTITQSGWYGEADALALQSDGKIVVGGYRWLQELSNGFWVRLNSDGSLESSEMIPTVFVSDAAVQNDGKIVFIGRNSSNQTAITRFNADKTLDTAFGNSGINTVTWTGSGSGAMNCVLIQPSGRIVVGGYANLSSPYPDTMLARFNSNGFLDVGFGTDGKVVTRIGTMSDEVKGMAQQADGKIVVVGSARNSTDYDFFVARYDGGNSNTSANRTPFDFDGDGRADVSVTRPSQNVWYQILSGNSSVATSYFGSGGDVIAPADYNGDGKTDIAIFRPSTGAWWFSVPVEGSNTIRFGQSGDIPRPSDFDGDGKADLVVYRPSTGSWIRRSPTGQSSTVAFGTAEDKPLIGDFDGDGKADPAIFRPSTGAWWYAASSANGQHRATQWGISTDIPAPADYDGDGKTDLAVYRASEGGWYILRSSGGYAITQFGLSEDKPIAADYDGDGKADVAVFRPSTGVWYLMRSTSGFSAIQWGVSTDVPSQSAFIP